ncbi:hypothetical protein PG995_003161 [Apiospora arundinis]
MRLDKLLGSPLVSITKSPKITLPQSNFPEWKEWESPSQRSEQPSQPMITEQDGSRMKVLKSKAWKTRQIMDGPDPVATYGGKYESNDDLIVSNPSAYVAAYNPEESLSLPVASETAVPSLSRKTLPSNKDDEPVIKSTDASPHAVAGQSPPAKDEGSLNPNTNNMPFSGFNHGLSLYDGVSPILGSITMSLGTDPDHSFHHETLPPLSKMPPPSRTNDEISGISEGALKRGRNTLAARKLRERRARYTQGMLERIEKLEKD